MHPGDFFRPLLVAMLFSCKAVAVADAKPAPLNLASSFAVSPDGATLAFEWDRDIWTASADGGDAKRVVDDPARDDFPKFSRDGKRIVFSSDRTGSMQIYSIPMNGGEATRHSWNTEGSELDCLSPDGRHALVHGIREFPGSRATRLLEIDLTADRRERRLFDAEAHSAVWSPDGTRVLFCRGGEALYRKGYHGSRASQIWLYQIQDRTFERVVSGDDEARSPIWLPDGKGFYYVSNEGGTFNLWLHPDGGKPLAVTDFHDDGVISPALSADGSTMVFQRGLDVFRLRPGRDKQPVRLEFHTGETLTDRSVVLQTITRTESADVTNDLSKVVFSAAGDLWWTSPAGGPPSRLTETDEDETEVTFSPDGTWLYFLRDDGIHANYFRAHFKNGLLMDESPVTHGVRSKCRFKRSPDGTEIAWVEGTGDVFTARADGAESRCVFKCRDRPDFDWSPDGRWLALSAKDRNANRDLWLVASDGKQDAVNLTRSPFYDGAPKWSPDGRWLAYISSKEAATKPQLRLLDFGKPGLSREPSLDTLLKAADEAKNIQTNGIEPTRLTWSPDSKSLWFQSTEKSSRKLFSVGLDGQGMKTIADQRGTPVRNLRDGGLLWFVDGVPELFKPGQTLRFPISLHAARPRAILLGTGFRRIWRLLGENFHDARMNGRDWNAMRMKYESAATTARNSLQFARVVNQLTGELNSSHLTFTRQSLPDETLTVKKDETTAHPGLIFRDDDERPDAPLVISRVIAGSPVSMRPDTPKAGDVVLRIGGEDVSNGSPLHHLFAGAEGRPLPLVIQGDTGGHRVVELRCITYQKARWLRGVEQENTNRAIVARMDPKSAYIRVPDMNRETIRETGRRIYQASLVADRLILDLRNNGGGREADRLLEIFCQPLHAFTIPRDGEPGYPMDRRNSPAWDKPLAVLCNQNTLSNAEIFCHAVHDLKRASLIGTTTAGDVVSAVKTDVSGLGSLMLPFRAWYQIDTGKNLELNGAIPDLQVEPAPSDEGADLDPQLERAIEILRKQNGSNRAE